MNPVSDFVRLWTASQAEVGRYFFPKILRQADANEVLQNISVSRWKNSQPAVKIVNRRSPQKGEGWHGATNSFSSQFMANESKVQMIRLADGIKIIRLSGKILLSLILGLTISIAQDAPVQSALPKAVGPQHFEDLMLRSPFTRVVVLSDSLILTGVAWVNGKPIATLMNTEIVESIAVSETPTTQGLKLIELSGTDNIEMTVAVVLVQNDEVIQIRYDKERLKTANQRRKFATQARQQKAIAKARTSSGNAGNHGVPQERVAMLKTIEKRELPEGYNPGKGRSREESHNLHQSYVDRRMSEMSDRQKGIVGQMWKQKTTVEPNMPNRGASFVRIMEHVAENEKR